MCLLWGFNAAPAWSDTLSECPEPPADESARRKLAGEWFATAQSFVEDERFPDAVRAFECSILMVEHPDTIFNAARAAKLAGDAAAAVRYAGLYLEKRPEGEVAEEARLIIEELGDSVKSPEPETPEPGDTPPETPEPEDHDVEAPEPPPVEASEQVSDAGTTVDQNPPPAKPQRPKLAIAGITALGVGGAGVVVGAVMQGLASNAWASGNSTTSYRDFKEYNRKMERFQTGALVGLIAGGVVAGAGLTMLLLQRGGETKQVALEVAPGGLIVSGRF